MGAMKMGAMNRSARWWLGLALAAALPSACDESLLDTMAFRQPRAKAYKESRFFSDGLDMRPPPAGTMAREWRPARTGSPASVALATGYSRRFGPLASNGDVQRVYAAQVPLPLTRPLLERGRDRYDIYCAACHGRLGDGNSIVARQMALRPPPSLHLYRDRPPGYIFEVITRGFGLMPAYAEMTAEDRWAVVAYVQVLQVSQNAQLDSAPPDIRRQLQGAGKEQP